MNNRIVRLPEVRSLTGLSSSTIYRLEQKGVFPGRLSLSGSHAVGWSLAAVTAWIESRCAPARERDGGVGQKGGSK